MNLITKNNILSFLEYYHEFHDSNITNINYDIINLQIEIFINVFWSGIPLQKNNGTYETNNTKIKIIFKDVEQCNIKEIFTWDYIEKIYLKYIKIQNKEYICFANAEKNPSIYIVCNSIEYEKLN